MCFYVPQSFSLTYTISKSQRWREGNVAEEKKEKRNETKINSFRRYTEEEIVGCFALLGLRERLFAVGYKPPAGQLPSIPSLRPILWLLVKDSKFHNPRKDDKTAGYPAYSGFRLDLLFDSNSIWLILFFWKKGKEGGGGGAGRRPYSEHSVHAAKLVLEPNDSKSGNFSVKMILSKNFYFSERKKNWNKLSSRLTSNKKIVSNRTKSIAWSIITTDFVISSWLLKLLLRCICSKKDGI